MKRIGLLLLFLVVLAGGLAGSAPLSLLVGKSALPAMGVGWQQARGTVWNGQLVGVDFRGMPLGSLSVKSTPLNLLRRLPVHQATWRFGPSRAVADVRPEGQGIALENGSAEILLRQFAPGIASAYSINTAHIRLKRVSAVYNALGCVSVSGAVSSDIAQELGGKLGMELPELAGTVICEGGALKAHLEGQAVDGSVIDLDILQGQSAILTMDNITQETAFALAAAGYEVSGTHFEHVIPLTEDQ